MRILFLLGLMGLATGTVLEDCTCSYTITVTKTKTKTLTVAPTAPGPTEVATTSPTSTGKTQRGRYYFYDFTWTHRGRDYYDFTQRGRYYFYDFTWTHRGRDYYDFTQRGCHYFYDVTCEVVTSTTSPSEVTTSTTLPGLSEVGTTSTTLPSDVDTTSTTSPSEVITTSTTLPGPNEVVTTSTTSPGTTELITTSTTSPGPTGVTSVDPTVPGTTEVVTTSTTSPRPSEVVTTSPTSPGPTGVTSIDPTVPGPSEVVTTSTTLPGPSEVVTTSPTSPGLTGVTTVDPTVPGTTEVVTTSTTLPGPAEVVTTSTSPGPNNVVTPSPTSPGPSEVVTISPTTPGPSEVVTISPTLPGPSEVLTISPTLPGPSEVVTISPTLPGPSEVVTTSPTSPGPSEIVTISPTTPGTTEVVTTSPTSPGPTGIVSISPTSPCPTEVVTTSPTSPGPEPGDGDSSTLIVCKNPSKGQYLTVTAALAAIPDNGRPYTIYIKSGIYEEQITISRKGRVVLRGETSFKNDFTKNTVTIQYSDAATTSSSDKEKTGVITVEDTGGETVVALYNINFKNTSPRRDNTEGLAADFDGLVAAYGCSFIGYHHTLFAKKGSLVLSNSYVEGSGDFIWGYATLFAHQSWIAVNTPGHSIAEQGRSSSAAKGGFVFDTSLVSRTDSCGNSHDTFLGRPLNQYSLVVYMNSFLDSNIDPAGWSGWSTSSPQTAHVLFGEYNNSGPGSSLSARASFATKLSKRQAAAYSLSEWISDTSWLDMAAYNYKPSYDLAGGDLPAPEGESGGSGPGPGSGSGSGSGPGGNGGALVVSPTTIANTKTYKTIQDALDHLPSGHGNVTVFIYPGTYKEKLVIDYSRTIILIGYTKSKEEYSKNQVTIRSDSTASSDNHEALGSSATILVKSGHLRASNINIVNKRSGTKNRGAVALAINESARASLYDCQTISGQISILVDGNLFVSNSYIEGSGNPIYGSGPGKLVCSTISLDGSGRYNTVDERELRSMLGNLVLDQVTFRYPRSFAPAGRILALDRCPACLWGSLKPGTRVLL
ncbi:hypothetical protein N7468_000041 [Penicillium chermesinum]|uniref:pectinesterase n=1 Tax=Penicillium chermesinum TaxID=63820 RepID=A0A9W9PLL4_9EURO|nr:uncharacterized protein N7468_000041 [Penicillium chermesinum]KAJ5248590.1 hypothetical protein N7468_000041 [Penicillium chermesinum]